MFSGLSISAIADYILFASCIFILLGCLFITFRMKFIQVRFFPSLFQMLKSSILSQSQSNQEGKQTIAPHKALLTAMSTTLGISTIVAPVIAISLGGPGALIGFILTSFFGSAATFCEVHLSIKHRTKSPTGAIMGGPMEYLKHLLSPAFAKWYAMGCFILMAAWSSAQANQLAAILNSPLLGSYSISTAVSGAAIAIIVVLILMGGIKRISEISSKMVPTMFFLYLSSTLWIIFYNYDKLPGIFGEIFSSAFTPYALANGAVVGGIISALRWGTFKGMQTCEAGIGTQAIPHAMAETKDPTAQGTLAMLSTLTAGFIAFLSGCVALITQTWLDPTLPIGITMVAASFEMYFASFGIVIVVIATILFAFGTILGNSYNGSQCFESLLGSNRKGYYIVGSAVIIFLGAISDVTTVWALVDIVMGAVALPHMVALIKFAYQNPSAANTKVLAGDIHDPEGLPIPEKGI